ncbi:MAG TPA: N-acetylmuramoyl-L-alanine amidase [Solirubrobacteraceae bacterium]|nr:N-acetylmuramoyl-L-alanine amidase [Solirubrobacteraceae bacterium]
MSAGPMTRRSLLAASAGAIAGGILRPGATLALLSGPPRPTVWERRLGGLAASGARIELGRSADLVGVQWAAPAGAGVWVRFRSPRGGWSRWVSAGAHGHGPDGPSPDGSMIGDPVWTGGATAVQVRANRLLSGVRLHLVDVSDGVGARLAATRSPLAMAAALPLATPVLAAGPGQPPIIARRAWAQGIAPPRVSPGYGAVRMAFVHHTENPNGYAAAEVPAMLRAIYAYHRFARGWNDIGYNFVVDLYGRIFEARAGGIDEPVVGAQAGGYNLASTGVAVLGSFMETPISPAARNALERLLAWKLSLHGLPAMGRVTVRVNPAGAPFSKFPANANVSLARISGHRDADSTDCPGNALYGELATIRGRVRRLAGRPARATLTLLPAAAPAASGPGVPAAVGGARTLAGTLELLDGTPVGGAPIAVQARRVSAKGLVVSERTLAESSTDPLGRWSLALSVVASRAGTWLRVLSTGAPGTCVSEPLYVPGTVLLSAPPPAPSAPAPTPPAAPPPAT